MKPGTGQKSKGKKYEEKIANLLHKHFMENHSGYKDLFDSVGNPELRPKRDFASGNMTGSHGDINLNLLKNFFPYSIECKHWASLDVALNTLIKGKLTSLEKIWKDQAVPKAKICSLNPIIVFSANRTEMFCFLKEEQALTDSLNGCDFNYVRTAGYVIMKFEDFLTFYSN